MRPLYLVLIIAVVAIILIAGYVWLAKPTVVLPPVNIAMMLLGAGLHFMRLSREV